MKSLYDYSDGEIGLFLIGGSVAIALIICLGLCGVLHSLKLRRHGRRRRPSSSSNGDGEGGVGLGGHHHHHHHHRHHHGDGGGGGGGGGGVGRGIIRQQSQSVVRGEHPIAFMLPTVPPSEPCSEFSDLESMTTTYSISPSISATASAASGSQYPSWRRLRNINPHQTVHYARPPKPSSAKEHQRQGRQYRRHTIGGRRRRHYSPLIPDRRGSYGDAEEEEEEEDRKEERGDHGGGGPEEAGSPPSLRLSGLETQTEPEEEGTATREEEEEKWSRSMPQGFYQQLQQSSSSTLYSPRGQRHRHHRRKARSATTSPRSFDVSDQVIRESLLEAQGGSPGPPKRGSTLASVAGAGEPPKEGDHGGEEDGEEEEEEEKEEDEDEEARSVGGEGDLGNVRARFRVDWDNNLVISEIYVRGIAVDQLRSGRVAVRIRVYPESSNVFETGVMSVFDDKILLLDPIALPIENISDSPNYVVKLSLVEKSSPPAQPGRRRIPPPPAITVTPASPEKEGKEEEAAPKPEQQQPAAAPAARPATQIYGHAVLNLLPHLPIRGGATALEANIHKKVSQRLVEIFSDKMEISLCYDAEVGKLTLGIIQAELATPTIRRQQQMNGHEALLYTKVTLYEGHHTMKAKKTRPVGFNNRPQFHETFNIVVPENYLTKLSCLIGLYVRNKQGSKMALGRLCLGASFSHGSGRIHWERMAQNPGGTIIQWHHLQ